MKAYYKLVRDKIPQIYKKEHKNIKTKKLNKEEFNYYLKIKLKEKVNDFLDSKTLGQTIDELTEIYEVLDNITKNLNLTSAKIKALQDKKRKDLGGFNDKQFLILIKE